MTEVLRTNIVFQGGGAKGILHVGSLAAIETASEFEGCPKFEVSGFAGSSIGALIATLAAAGYTSEEMIDENGKIPLAEGGVLRPQFIVGKVPWFFIRSFRAIVRGITFPRRYPWFLVLSLLLVCATFLLAVMGVYAIQSYEDHFATGMVVVLIILAAAMMLLAWLRRGIGNLAKFEHRLSEVLVEKILSAEVVNQAYRRCDDDIRGGVTFQDFKALGRELRIVAANVTDRNLRVFGQEPYDMEINVAQAVTASMAIPGLVAPVVIDGKRYYDGGLVSNIPVWTFDARLAADPDAVTVMCLLRSPSKVKDENRALWRFFKKLFGRAISLIFSPLSYVFEVFYTGIFGSQNLEIRETERHIALPLEPDRLGVLDLDLDAKSIASFRRDAKAVTQGRLANKFAHRPTIYRVAFDDLGDRFARRLETSSPDESFDGYVGVRMFLASEIRSADSLKIYACSDNTSYDVDDRLYLPLEGTIAGEAFKHRMNQLCLRENFLTRRLNGRRYRYIRRLKWPSCEWCLAVPVQIGGQSEDCHVIVLESDIALDRYGLPESVNDDDWKEPLIYISHVISESIRGVQSLDEDLINS